VVMDARWETGGTTLDHKHDMETQNQKNPVNGTENKLS
jgi:hypothetical protein